MRILKPDTRRDSRARGSSPLRETCSAVKRARGSTIVNDYEHHLVSSSSALAPKTGPLGHDGTDLGALTHTEGWQNMLVSEPDDYLLRHVCAFLKAGKH